MRIVLVGLLLAVGGCATESYNELLDRYDAECLGQEKTSQCEEMNESLMNMEERRARKQREEEQERAMVAYCKSQDLILYCDQRGVDRNCQCASREALSGLFHQFP